MIKVYVIKEVLSERYCHYEKSNGTMFFRNLDRYCSLGNPSLVKCSSKESAEKLIRDNPEFREIIILEVYATNDYPLHYAY